MALNPRITDWRGKRVWIVGASTGIGAALAIALAERGARLALSARRPEALSEVVGRCGDALALPLDVTHEGDYAAARSALLTRWEAIDLVIFNAGTYEPLRAWALDEAAIRRTLDVNLLGVMDGVAAVLPGMLAAGRGGLAIVASVAGYGGLPRAAAYGASKAALINFAESLYLDLAPLGLAVWLINPGFVATPLTAKNDFQMPALISAEQAAAEMLAGFASGRFEIHFPKRFSRVVKLLSHLPYSLYFSLIRKVTGS